VIAAIQAISLVRNGNGRQRTNLNANEVQRACIQANSWFLDGLKAELDNIDRQAVEPRCGYVGWRVEIEISMQNSSDVWNAS
jgi:hypothetical protein